MEIITKEIKKNSLIPFYDKSGLLNYYGWLDNKYLLVHENKQTFEWGCEADNFDIKIKIPIPFSIKNMSNFQIYRQWLFMVIFKKIVPLDIFNIIMDSRPFCCHTYRYPHINCSCKQIK